MAEGCVKLDLEGTVAMIRRFTHAIDTVWCRALRSGAPADMVMALDEASPWGDCKTSTKIEVKGSGAQWRLQPGRSGRPCQKILASGRPLKSVVVMP
jgi:hypothetical protein